tara:strand:- start:570 stop:959 length:390 start_codon:yes stop_codon:yes gene_type:complete
MTVQELKYLGYHKIAEAAEKNNDPNFSKFKSSDLIVDLFYFIDTDEGEAFWDCVSVGLFEAALSICPQYREEQRFYASEIEESLNENVCYIADRTNDDASKGLTMITLTYSDREELEERVEQILQTLNK